MKNNVNNFGKIFFKIEEKCIKAISLFNHPVYMKMYIKYLKKRSMDIDGTPIYIASSVSFDGKDLSKIHIGNHVVISSDVRVLTHDYSLSRGFEAANIELAKEVYLLRDVYIGDNTFIGNRAILMPGCRIGKNVIVGAGAVVRGCIQDNTIVIGNPAKKIGDTIEWAMKKFECNNYYVNKN